MATFVSRLTCGFCGFVSPNFNAGDAWAPYYRAVYCTGPEASQPRLSGIGHHDYNSTDNYLPPESHQRYDDNGLTPLTMIQIRDIKPPGPEVPEQERATYAWGFQFHDACWSLLQQAVKPDAVDVQTLWRVLLSVPCGTELPNWGHSYGGLYTGTVKDQAKGDHFVLLGPNSNLVIPSTFSNPFKVPELQKVIAELRIERRGDGYAETRGQETTKRTTVKTHAKRTAHIDGYPASDADPFAKLPLELRELLLCYCDTADVLQLRLTSRGFATTPLTQQFFMSRFWPGHEMNVFFDAFLLPPGVRRGTDFARLYGELKFRLRYNRVCLGERNRLRIWGQTVKPLAEALGRVGSMSKLAGGPGWRWGEGDGVVETPWKVVKTRHHENFEEARRVVHRAEVKFPSEDVKGVYISMLKFFGTQYVTGLRFVFANDKDVEIGYTSKTSEKFLAVEACLRGFYTALDECGFRALALMTGKHMPSEYLEWVGDVGALSVVPCRTSGKGVRRVRAMFDGFRMQALLIPEGANSLGKVQK
ncbi:uncharacterized protein BCR38DRAFT_478382 [Pseudomassariella vexata]|uniref:DUF7600 domain-containing protein n=1 Tax=Pseudomassariella vexata TaxID=1141098 RepID=A0A1Y2DD53_9PEZI|nr:uncharacterized protein BCR38DRAFT_478382 [Pseudomassariella vexata]ORY57188.1 hypothetical protein BCR38DRAFT_478382 [Pseudomassariella vexata]